MAVDHAGSPRRRFGGLLDALFGEALELERRRRRRWTLLLLLCCVAAGASLLATAPGGSGTRGGTATGSSHVIVSSHQLPLSSNYTGLSVAHGRLLLIDYGTGGFRGAAGTCRVATADPASLRLVSVSRGSCDDPALFGEHVMEVRQFGVGPIRVRVATADSHAKRGYTLGPVLFSYNQCSDCWDLSIAGPRALWIYAPISTPRGYRAGGGELFRVSERTGRALQHWRMPSMVRPVLAVDADGLWIAPSIETGNPYGLYHVAPGMRRPQRALTIGNDARFLVASGHTVWFETWNPQQHWAELWRLHGGGAAKRRVRMTPASSCSDTGEGPATVLGNGAGIYCSQLSGWSAGTGASKQGIFRITPGSWSEQHIATVTPVAGSFDPQAAADLGNSYYFIDPSTYQGTAAKLFRVGPS